MNKNQNNVKIGVNKSLLKEFTKDSKRIVYMNDNTEFQIQLFNPYDYTIGASISINGTRMNNLLVIKPGQRIWLERYLNEARKFLFETYEVDGNSETVRKAIAHNGLIEVSYHREKRPFISTWQEPHFYTYTNDNGNINSIKDVPWMPTIMFSSTVGDTLTTSNTVSSSINDGGKLRCATSINTSNKIETGRVEKGGHSNQKFYDSNTEFDYYSFHMEKIHIMPMSQKAYNANDLKKIYCHECGRKLNTRYKFCPYCGTKI